MKLDEDQRRISEFIKGVRIAQDGKRAEVQKMTGLESLNMKKMQTINLRKIINDILLMAFILMDSILVIYSNDDL